MFYKHPVDGSTKLNISKIILNIVQSKFLFNNSFYFKGVRLFKFLIFRSVFVNGRGAKTVDVKINYFSTERFR